MPTMNGSGAHQVVPEKPYPDARGTWTSERTPPRSIVTSNERAPACAACEQRTKNPANDTPRRSSSSRRSRRSPTARGLASAPGDDRTRNTIGYDCSSGADDTQNGGNTKSPRTPWTTDMTKPNTQTGRSVPSSSQSTAASRCRGRGGAGGTSAGGGRDAAATAVGSPGGTAGAGRHAAGPRGGAPHSPQNLSPGRFAAPHDAQSAASAVPHSAQKRRSRRLSWPQDGQRIARRLSCGDLPRWARRAERSTAGATPPSGGTHRFLRS